MNFLQKFGINDHKCKEIRQCDLLVRHAVHIHLYFKTPSRFQQMANDHQILFQTLRKIQYDVPQLVIKMDHTHNLYISPWLICI